LSQSADAGTSSSGPYQVSPNVDSLTVAIPATQVDFLEPYIAQGAGIFTKNKLNVHTLDNAGPNTLTDVVSGQADLANYTGPPALQAAAQGKQTSIIYGLALDPGAALITPSSITSLTQLQALKHCTIGANAQGSQGYAYATIYKKELNLNCDIVAASQPALQLGGLTGGTYQAVVTTTSTAVAGTANGDHILIDPTKPAEVQKYGKRPNQSGVLFGVTADLQSKRSAVVKYIRSMGEALKLFETSSNAQVATWLKDGDPGFAATPEATLEQQIQAVRPYHGPVIVGKIGDGTKGTIDDEPGFIGPGAWIVMLNMYTNYGLQDFDPTAAVNSYSQRVDMSYYDEAFSNSGGS
jgi:ABC-type nitrate/sulfonate/bicarbonate transport system substrate-binding protein